MLLLPEELWALSARQLNMATDFPDLIRSTPKPQPTKKPRAEKGKDDKKVETEVPGQTELTTTVAPAAEWKRK